MQISVNRTCQQRLRSLEKITSECVQRPEESSKTEWSSHLRINPLQQATKPGAVLHCDSTLQLDPNCFHILKVDRSCNGQKLGRALPHQARVSRLYQNKQCRRHTHYSYIESTKVTRQSTVILDAESQAQSSTPKKPQGFTVAKAL